MKKQQQAIGLLDVVKTFFSLYFEIFFIKTSSCEPPSLVFRALCQPKQTSDEAGPVNWSKRKNVHIQDLSPLTSSLVPLNN